MTKKLSPCSRNEYLVNGRCCLMCPAGSHKLKDCTDSANTQCETCENGTYMEHENSFSKCQPCSHCQGFHFSEASHCNQTHDALCQCSQGFYCSLRSRGTCELCNHLSSCGVGFGVLKRATSWVDTVCQICQTGTFSNVSDTSSPCLNHTKCPVLKFHGTNTTDSVCATPSATLSASSWFLLLTLSVPLVIISFTLIILLWRYRCRNRSTMRLRSLETLRKHRLDKYISVREGMKTMEMPVHGQQEDPAFPRSLFPTNEVLDGESLRKIRSNTYCGPLLQSSPAPCKHVEKCSAKIPTASVLPPVLPIKVKCAFSAEMAHLPCPASQSESTERSRGCSSEMGGKDDACCSFCIDGVESPLRTLDDTCPVSLPTLTASQNFKCDSYCMVQPCLETEVNPCSNWAPPCELRSQVQERQTGERSETSQPEEDEWKE
ncbi:tumor necrosis factor receptor superfamily member 5 [Microcaecilia unicolor]|uniref:Tumor necrosis factor receptor superfamily member 5-like n=1 Tax=Microcaecilia unicolor TaxID=1415580 RepID=A0A6P7WSA3_9AMPH|nr:tumor necrosis factor receptor superfamily member 5-like [Microcaecilia unicolor]